MPVFRISSEPRHIEVLDGFSVIYDDDDAIAWQENVASHLTSQYITYGFKFSVWGVLKGHE